MPKHTIDRTDIMPIAQYAEIRRDHRRKVTGIKQHRRVEVGPFATFYFENYDTIWHQIHEMLYIEKGGEDQITDELAAYQPLIPRGDDLVATVMFEIDDPVRRTSVLNRLGGVENHTFVSVDGQKIQGSADPDRENTSPEGKASSVQFIHFTLNATQKAAFAKPGVQVLLGFDHPNYGHIAVMSDPVRSALAQDFS
ncbi:MAG TPA: DUF3501 family protein [Stellaceae bacterium]|nr:DUF3501 family protein [Stellaceae bacterium]